ncbi:MAG: Gfo/Idh/MocA family oxidoreductase [Planctomycetales bacterium]|nr:Gfo/Idh/MocA family oxidoreductase [Planctomycetales bacterium]
MTNARFPQTQLRVAIVSAVKHDYVARGILSHNRYHPVVVTDEADCPDWIHSRNQMLADQLGVPYVRGVETAIREHRPDVAVVSSEAARHCELSVIAAKNKLHIVQDKPMSTQLESCDALVDAVEENGVKFMMWNRNYLPAIVKAREAVQRGDIGTLRSIHVDFYFAKDAGPPLGSRSADDPPLNWLEMQKEFHATGADGGVGTTALGEFENEAIYPLAYIHSIVDRRVERVFARATSHFHQLHHDNGVEDLASISMEMSRGTYGSICIGRIGNASHPNVGEIKLHLVGTEGSLVISEARPEIATYYKGQPDTEFTHQRLANDNDWLLADHFAQAIDSDSPTCLDVRSSRAICSTVHAALKSSQINSVVSVEHR